MKVAAVMLPSRVGGGDLPVMTVITYERTIQ